MAAVSLVCQLFGALVLAVDAAPYFRWGDAGQQYISGVAVGGMHPDIRQSCCRRACNAWDGPSQNSNTPPRRDIVLSPSSSWGGGTRPSSSDTASPGGCFWRRVLRASSCSGFCR